MRKKFFRSELGMTLIEIMVVVAIIAGITGLVAVSVIGRKGEADIKLTKEWKKLDWEFGEKGEEARGAEKRRCAKSSDWIWRKQENY